ncbi:MAG: hypothetical protein RLN69_14165 [Woeseiaceae bacterium]
MTLLRTVFIVQLVLMLPAFAFLVVTPASFQTLGLLFYLVPPGFVIALYGLWQWKTHPERRRLALATAATPLICLALPFGIVALNGGPVPQSVLTLAVIVLIVFAVFVLLGKTDQWRDGGAFSNRHFNFVYLLVLLILFALLWLPALVWLPGRENIVLPAQRAGAAPLLDIAIWYYLAVATPSFLLSLFALIYAPVGLVRNANGRVMHLLQVLAALLLMMSLAVCAYVGVVVLANPG